MAHDLDTPADPAILGLLMARPQHGYELFQEFGPDLRRVWQVGLSQLYAHLKQLEESGLVSAKIEPQPSRPARKVYHLTAEGRETFLTWLHRPTSFLRQIRVEFLLRLYFFDRLGLPGFEGLVSAQRARCQEQAERFASLAGESADRFERLVYQFRQGQLEAVISWLDRCSAEISSTEVRGGSA